MREILFKGKRVIDGKWVESCCPLGEMHSGTVTYDFVSETVCQYTGLTDNNGKKIFEGDIINDIDYGIMKCIYLHGSFVWYKEDGFKIECMKYVPIIEVIGNIFDNPELIGE